MQKMQKLTNWEQELQVAMQWSKGNLCSISCVLYSKQTNKAAITDSQVVWPVANNSQTIFFTYFARDQKKTPYLRLEECQDTNTRYQQSIKNNTTYRNSNSWNLCPDNEIFQIALVACNLNFLSIKTRASMIWLNCLL